MPTPLDPPQLNRFPADVRAAYRTYRTTGDAAAVQFIVLSAVREHGPRLTTLTADPDHVDHLRLVADLGYDSLAIAELIFFLEDLFDVSIRTPEVQTITNIGELRDFVARKLAEKSAAA